MTAEYEQPVDLEKSFPRFLIPQVETIAPTPKPEHSPKKRTKEKQTPVTIRLSPSNIRSANVVLTEGITKEDANNMLFEMDDPDTVQSSIKGTALDVLDKLCLVMLREEPEIDVKTLDHYFPTYPSLGKAVMAEHINESKNFRGIFDRIYNTWCIYREQQRGLIEDGEADDFGNYYTKEQLNQMAMDPSVGTQGIYLIQNWIRLKHQGLPILDKRTRVLLGFGAIVQFRNICIQATAEFDALVGNPSGDNFNIVDTKLGRIDNKNDYVQKLERALMLAAALVVKKEYWELGSGIAIDEWMIRQNKEAIFSPHISFFYRSYRLRQDGQRFQSQVYPTEPNDYSELQRFGEQAFKNGDAIRAYIRRSKNRGWVSPPPIYKIKNVELANDKVVAIKFDNDTGVNVHQKLAIPA